MSLIYVRAINDFAITTLLVMPALTQFNIADIKKMDPSRAHIILPTNATSITNPLANSTPTTIVRDTVIQTNRENEPSEYREIITTEKVLQPILLEHAPPSDSDITAKTTTTTIIKEIPKVFVPCTTTRTTVIEEVPAPVDYVIKSAGAFHPVTMVSENTPVNKIVTTTVTEPVTKKIIKTTETIETIE